MELWSLEIISASAILALLIYYYFTCNFHYWRNRDVPGPKPIPVFGNLKNVVLGKMSIGDFVKSQYDEYKGQSLFGVYAMRMPVLIINDPDLIKNVLIKNFSFFADRGVRLFEKVEPLSPNLVNLEVARWRPLRAKQTTMFSSLKLKEMFSLLLEGADNLEKTLKKITANEDIVECCEVTSRFTTDVIGVCVFGMDMKALEDEDSQFRRVGRKFIHADKWRAFKLRLKLMFPTLYELLGPIMYDHEVNDFFIKTILDTIKHRKECNIRKGDFLDLLINLKDDEAKLDGIELTDSLLTAQAFAFFFAGFDTSSTTMSHALYELALNQSIQDKLRDEILDELAKNNGRLLYESMKNMTFLNKVFSETLRKYPVTTILTRQSTETFTFPEQQLTISKGTRIWIPVYGIHRDPKVYPDPDSFDPERFNEDQIIERHPFHYLPFGAGPRNCLGARFGTFQTKVGIATILKSYKVGVSEKTTIPYVSNKRRFLLGPASGIYLKFTKLTERV